MAAYNYPTIVIGAGAGGLVIAIGLAKAGKKVLLIEKGNYGGDCTNFGCIPSKSLIASAHCAHSLRNCLGYGVKASIGEINGDGAFARTRCIVEEVRGHEDPKALAEQGVDTLTGVASFVDPHTLKVSFDDGTTKTVTGKHIVIATGSHPRTPPIEGLDRVPYRTNETIFELDRVPESLGVIGGGPIGSELAQAFQRLGAKVTQIQHSAHLLKKEESEAQAVIEETFIHEGIDLRLNTETHSVKQENGKIVIEMDEGNVTVSELLVATGRIPSIGSLNLDGVGIETYARGVKVDRYGRTSQKHIYAVGDVTGRAVFTHVAENEARSVLTSLLMPWPLKSKLDLGQAIPRVTYTDPEVAALGLTEQSAVEHYGVNKIAVYHLPFKNVDRALTTGRTEGFVKVVTKKWSSKILGATIVGPRAGEMLAEISVAMRHGIPLRKLSSLIHAYPTYSRAIRKAADQWLTKTILPALLRKS